MKFSHPRCPVCARRLPVPWFKSAGISCPGCASRLELEPRFLSTTQGLLLFFAGALLLGTSLTDFLTWEGFAERSVQRVLADLLIAGGYYGVWRYVCFRLQHARVTNH
jgi:hypothetical protein